MKKFLKDDNGQMILIACVFIVLSLVLIAIYEYSTLGTGEASINRENIDSFYYYKNIRERYTRVYNSDQNSSYWDFSRPNNITLFEKELKQFALQHGYGLSIIRNNTQAKIIFVDKNLKIEETIKR